MGVTFIRVLIAVLGVLLMLGGIAAASPAGGGDLAGALVLFLPGAALVGAVALERTRYRSLAAERTGDGHGPGGGEVDGPDARFRPTEELFIDPTTGARMRVWLDARTGDRRYLAEG